jgi:hypothetical protein
MEARPFRLVIIATLALQYSSWLEARPVLDTEEDVMLTSAMVSKFVDSGKPPRQQQTRNHHLFT